MRSRRDRSPGSRFQERSRSRSRPTLSPIPVPEEDSDEEHFDTRARVRLVPPSSSGGSDPVGNQNLPAAQNTLNVTNLVEVDLPLTTSMYRGDPDFTEQENETMGIRDFWDEQKKMMRRSDYVKFNALHDEDHDVTGLVDQIRKKIRESQVHYDQNPEAISRWKASSLRAVSYTHLRAHET